MHNHACIYATRKPFSPHTSRSDLVSITQCSVPWYFEHTHAMGNQKVLEEKLDPNYEPTPEGESKNVPLSYELNP